MEIVPVRWVAAFGIPHAAIGALKAQPPPMAAVARWRHSQEDGILVALAESAIREYPRQRQSIASSSLAPPRLGSIGAVDRTVDRLHGLALGANVEPANGSPDIGG